MVISEGLHEGFEDFVFSISGMSAYKLSAILEYQINETLLFLEHEDTYFAYHLN